MSGWAVGLPTGKEAPCQGILQPNGVGQLFWSERPIDGLARALRVLGHRIKNKRMWVLSPRLLPSRTTHNGASPTLFNEGHGCGLWSCWLQYHRFHPTSKTLRRVYVMMWGQVTTNKSWVALRAFRGAWYGLTACRSDGYYCASEDSGW